MMDILIIREDSAYLSELVELIANSSSYPQLVQNWDLFVQSLEVNYSNNLKRTGFGREQLRELLITWSSEKGSGATLSVLCDALNNCQAEDISELLEKKYWLVATKSLRIKLHERIFSLEEVCNQTSEKEYRNIYNELKTSIYTQPIELFRGDLIPQIETNYIARSLRSRIQSETDTGISEDELLIIAQKDNRPTIISDSPGMGKTLLLANIATKVRKTNNSIAIFIFLNEFIRTGISDPPLAISSLIADYATKNEVNKLIMEEILKNGEFHFDLFLDAYDEVSDMQDVLDLVDVCLSELKRVENFTIYVTTRPHFRTRLERVLSVTSYELLPFSKLEQIQFIVSYWGQKTAWFGGNQDKKFKIFAEKCLEMLIQQFPDAEQEIATRIPLHCMTLAHAFLDDAMVVKTWTSGRLGKVFQAKSLFLMYRSLVDMKFRRILPYPESYFSHSVKYWLEGSVMTKYFNAHVRESLMLLFPDWIETFESDLNSEIEENILYSIGLLELCPRENRRKFVDKRLAEYMLADYIVKNLTIHHDRKCFQMLFDVFLQYDGVEIDPPQYNPKINKIYGLKYPVMNYFVNLLLDDQRQYNYYPRGDMLSSLSLIDFEPLCKAVELCAIHELEWCFLFTTNLLHHLSLNDMNLYNLIDLREKYFRNLPFLVTGRTNNSMLVCSLMDFLKNTFGMEINSHKFQYDGRVNYPWEEYLTPLHMAVYKGKYDVVLYFVRKLGEQLIHLKFLLHMCVRYSAKDDDALIEEKLAIIDFLIAAGARYKMDLRKETFCRRKPSEVEDVHPRLHAKLLELESESSKILLPPLPDVIKVSEPKNQNPVIVPNLNKLLGTGGTSAIYEGTFGDRIVAVKVMRVRLGEVENVKREIQTLIRCDDHDNVVKYHCESHSESNGQIEYLLAMELCEFTLAEFVTNKNVSLEKLKISEAPSSIEVLRQITEGLSHLHSRKEPIIHRDLKPENILLKARNGQIIVKLADFGISRIIQQGRTHHTTKDLRGTRDWISPEVLQACDSKEAFVRLTLKADIFSLGCIFWYVLSNGQNPFDQHPSSESKYQPKLRIDLLGNQTFFYSILRLILFMISFHEKDRPSIEDIKNHPIFWPVENKLSFITESFNSCSYHQLKQVENWIKRNYQKLAGKRHSNFDMIFFNAQGQKNGWLDCLNRNVQNALHNQNSNHRTYYNGKSLLHLVRALRNLRAHFGEKDVNVQNEVGHSPEDYLNYWHARFPFLFDFVWTALQPIRNSSLDKFYEGVHFDFSKIRTNENNFIN